LLKLLRDRGLQLPQLHIICQSLIVSRILDALPAWGGLLSAELKGRINAFLRRLYKYGFMHSVIDIEYLLASSNGKLFRNMQKCKHCLNHLLRPRKNNVIALRPAGHEFLLPICNYELHRRSFVVRCLFNFLTVYFNCFTLMFIFNFSHVRLSLNNKRLLTCLLNAACSLLFSGDFFLCFFVSNITRKRLDRIA